MIKKLSKKDGLSQNFTELHNRVRSHADEYAASKGLSVTHGSRQGPINTERAKKIAQAYEQMPHTPNHPETQRAYKALANETADQYNFIRSKGVKFSPMKEGAAPYKNSADLFGDLHQNNHMWYYPSNQGFGSEGADSSDHPLMQTVQTVDGPMVANDVFRAVHDYFGHAKEGHQFGPKGEEAAWQTHMQMYSPEAQRALTSETRGQNSWVNFGPHGEHNRANPQKTIYADQKAGLMPTWTMESDTMKKNEKEDVYHAATHGGRHFIFSPEKPLYKPDLEMSPEEVVKFLKQKGEDVEETSGKYGALERSLIVNDPKDVNMLHNLASRLGQESAIYSDQGRHEMHYYHGPNAGKIRHGHGTQVYENQPDDLYTSVTLPNGTSRYFSHNFDWDDDNLKHRMVKYEIAREIYGKLSEKQEKYDFQRYWDLMLSGLQKNSSIRTEGRVFVSMDGDNIGASVERAAMANDLDTIMRQSETIARGQKVIRNWAYQHDADIYIDGGDDIAFTLPAEYIAALESMRRQYAEATGFTITIGVGDTISRAGHAMLYGKLKGKNQTNEWSPEIAQELDALSRTLTPQEKMSEHGLLGKDEIPGGKGDDAIPQEFDKDQVLMGIRHEMEHTNDKDKALEIALDHLTEDPKYYTKLQGLEKALAPPKRPGEVSPDGRYLAYHHKGINKPSWFYNPELADKYDKFIDENRDKFVSKYPKESHEMLNNFIDDVRNDYHRHHVMSVDKQGGPWKVRARHLRGIMSGDDNYALNVHSPEKMTFTIHERHGDTGGSSTWNYHKKAPALGATGTDAGFRTRSGGFYTGARIGKSDTSFQNLQGGRKELVGYDPRGVYGIPELLFYRRYYGLSGGSSGAAQASQHNLRKSGISGRTRLVHYSTTPGLSHISPEFMGTGIGRRGAESRYGRPPTARSYYYIEGTDPENAVTAASRYRYTAELGPEHKIYDLSQDPEGIYEEERKKSMQRQVNPGIVNLEDVISRAKNAGYHGFMNSQGELPNAVALFHPHPVKQDKYYGDVKYDNDVDKSEKTLIRVYETQFRMESMEKNEEDKARKYFRRLKSSLDYSKFNKPFGDRTTHTFVYGDGQKTKQDKAIAEEQAPALDYQSGDMKSKFGTKEGSPEFTQDYREHVSPGIPPDWQGIPGRTAPSGRPNTKVKSAQETIRERQAQQALKANKPLGKEEAPEGGQIKKCKARDYFRGKLKKTGMMAPQMSTPGGGMDTSGDEDLTTVDPVPMA